MKYIHKPYKPNKPPKTLTKYEVVEKLTLRAYSGQQTFVCPQADSISVERERANYDEDDDDYDDKIVIVFSNKQEVENPNYKEQYKQYEAALERYNVDYEKWKVFDTKQREIQKERREKLTLRKLQKREKEKSTRQKLYEELKKEFEDNT